MKKFRIRYILLALFIILWALIYFFYVRDWMKPAKVNIDTMRSVTYFNNKSDTETALQGIVKACNNGYALKEGEEVRVLNKELGYKRIAYISSCESGTCVDISYMFEDAERPDYPFSRVRGNVRVLIFKNSYFKFNILTGPKFKYPSSMSFVELKEKNKSEYGRFSPVFNSMSKHGKEADFEYYVSPLIRSKNEFGFTYGNDGSVDLIFIYGDYAVYISEYFKNKDVLFYPIVIEELAELLAQAETYRS